MNLSVIQNKLYERLKPSGWADVLKTFILSESFATILKTLHASSTDGKHFTPMIRNLFRAFEECPYDKLNVVIIGQDPYPKIGVADGISFSCSLTGKEQPSLRYIFNELQKQYPDASRDTDLKRWSNQGVLMLNTAMTCEVGNIGSHIELWKPFTEFLLQTLEDSYTGVVYIVLGKKAEEWLKSIDEKNNWIFKCKHPAAAAYNGGAWDSDNLFQKVNDLLHSQYGEKINW
tara:strand:- start:1656 stop:2348 length:693 start_codon:yes stop_codon:yes gene_type:complete